MTNEVNESVVSEDVPAAEAASAEITEKTLKQSEADKIIGAVRHEARNKGFEEGRKAALAELQLTQAQNQQQTPAPAATPQAIPQNSLPIGNMHQGGMSEEAMRRMLDEEFTRRTAEHQQKSAWENTKNSFVSKVAPEAQKDPSFYKDVIEPLDLDNNPHLVTLTAHLDDPVSVLRELKANPEKIAGFTSLARTHPHLALSKMQDLSNSIKANQQALQQAHPNEPLSQLKPSTVTADNGSPQSASDFRKKSYLKY